jgi:hypothetical protein
VDDANILNPEGGFDLCAPYSGADDLVYPNQVEDPAQPGEDAHTGAHTALQPALHLLPPAR